MRVNLPSLEAEKGRQMNRLMGRKYVYTFTMCVSCAHAGVLLYMYTSRIESSK